MRVRIEIGEPVELVAYSEEEVTITGEEISEESSSEMLVLRTLPGSFLGNQEIDRLRIQTYFQGHTLEELRQGQQVMVAGVAYSLGSDPEYVGFIGRAIPLLDD